MYTSAIGGSGDTTSAAWNAIASIKSVSPFDDGSSSGSSSVADEFNSLIDTSASDALDGTSSSTDAAPSASSTSSSSMSSTNLALLRQIQNAEQSTVDVYA